MRTEYTELSESHKYSTQNNLFVPYRLFLGWEHNICSLAFAQENYID